MDGLKLNNLSEEDRTPERANDEKRLTNTAALRSHREVATALGIGRARVFFQEQVALQKLRRSLALEGVRDISDIDSIAVKEIPKGVGGKVIPFATANGWIRVTQVVSLNRGSTDVEDVSRAYVFLKESNATRVHPSVFISTPKGLVDPYTVEATALYDEALVLRCWPKKKNAPRSVASFNGLLVTAIVESEFGRDENGAFDVPILLCVIVSAPSQEA